MEYIRKKFGDEYLELTKRVLKKFAEGEQYRLTENGFALTENAWLISDFIISEFFKTE